MVADRDDPAAAYRRVSGRSSDAVVDVPRQPVHVRGAPDPVAASARHWVLVSTFSVYAGDRERGADESAALHDPWPGDGFAPDEEYGPAKVACERAVLDAVPGGAVRAGAGLIVGYGDRSDRFGYWLARFARAARRRGHRRGRLVAGAGGEALDGTRLPAAVAPAGRV